MVLFRDLLGAQMFLDGQRKIRSAFDGGVVGDDHDLAMANAPDAGDDACGGGFAVIEIVGGERREFEEWRTGVEQAFDPFPDEELSLFFLSLTIFFATSLID